MMMSLYIGKHISKIKELDKKALSLAKKIGKQIIKKLTT